MLYKLIVTFVCLSKESPETISVHGLYHRTNNAMESFNRLLNSHIMGGVGLSRSYIGLRKIEKTKATDAKLAKDSGGLTKPRQNTKTKVCIFFCFFLFRDSSRI